MVLLHTGDFTAFIAPPLPPPPPTGCSYPLQREALKFKTENVYAMVTRPVYVTCDPAQTAIGGPGENNITIFLNDQT